MPKAAKVVITGKLLTESLGLAEDIEVIHADFDHVHNALNLIIRHDGLDGVMEGLEPPIADINELEKLKLYRGGECKVPGYVATCPECGGQLQAECYEWDEETGKPTISLNVSCIAEENLSEEEYVDQQHRHWQSNWQPVIDKVHEWAGVVEV